MLLFEGLHVWTADSATPELRAEWIRVLNELAALDPAYVVAGHRTAGAPTDLTAISHTRDYLELFEKTVAASADAAQAEASLLAAYPDAGLKIAAEPRHQGRQGRDDMGLNQDTGPGRCRATPVPRLGGRRPEAPFARHSPRTSSGPRWRDSRSQAPTAHPKA